MLDHFSGGSSASDSPVAPSPDPAADSRRRRTLDCLERFEYPVELGTLATYVAAAERNVPVEAVSAAARERVAIRLHHVDVPKLVAGELVEYDPESRMVLYTSMADRGRYLAADRPSRSDTA